MYEDKQTNLLQDALTAMHAMISTYYDSVKLEITVICKNDNFLSNECSGIIPVLAMVGAVGGTITMHSGSDAIRNSSVRKVDTACPIVTSIV